ncbi:NAD(P)-binding domain-containing protein [Bacillus sp. S10(2024)]|uniref:NAD(P)-binding domain-containing protein n=1 Tax=Bacillus sp. S10(2024) TaxID=3162886 RepID=UPI003D1B2740
MNKLIHDVVIIGGGPGGIQLALTYKELCIEQGKEPNMVVLEAAHEVGHSFSKFPVHGNLISNNKLYSGKPYKSRYAERFDWNSLITKDKDILMRNYSVDFYPRRETVVQMLGDLVRKYELPVQYDTQWTGTKKNDQGLFEVETTKGIFLSRTVVVATGLKPSKPEVEGIEMVTMYEDMKPKEYYRDKRVLIIGKGNSGSESALDILNEANVIMLASPTPAKLAYQTHYVGNLRAVNSIIAENYQLKHQAALLDCCIQKIEKVEGGFDVTVAYVHANGEVEKLFFNEIVAATGFEANIESLIQDFKINILHKKFPSINGVFESTEVENLYFAGVQTHGLDYKSTSTSGFIHGFRYNSKILAHHLTEKLGIAETRTKPVEGCIVELILDELNNSGELWLQPALVGLLLQNKNGQWKEMGHRTSHEFEGMEVEEGEVFVFVTLEYGDIHKFQETLNIPRVPGDASQSVHIHPVIRVKTEGDIQENHLEEHLESRFDKEKYVPFIKGIINQIEVVHA